MPNPAVLMEYDARVDAKKRVTIRGTSQECFRIVHRKDGTIVLKPRKVEDPPVSARTLRAMDEAMRNMRAGIQSESADLEKYARFAR